MPGGLALEECRPGDRDRPAEDGDFPGAAGLRHVILQMPEARPFRHNRCDHSPCQRVYGDGCINRFEGDDR